jgi:O-antigen/teichoic acid export membrane protein
LGCFDWDRSKSQRFSTPHDEKSRFMSRVAAAGQQHLLADFLRATGVLVSGTAGAQLVTAAAMPLVARLYGPAEFGSLAVFNGVVTTVSVAACLRYDIALALPEREEDAFALLTLAFMSAVSVALLTFGCVGFVAAVAPASVLQVGTSDAIWLIPIGVLCASVWLALQNWGIRSRRFSELAAARVSQSVAGGGVQIGIGLLGSGAIGLLGGSVAGYAVAALVLALGLRRITACDLPRLKVAKLRQIGWEYRRFPAYSTWEALANNASIQVPVILIGSVVAKSEAGYLMLAMYVMQAPMGLIGNATAQVYLSRAPEAHRRNELSSFTSEVLANLAKAGIGPILAISIASPEVFGLIFGPAWERAGWLVAWMGPWFALQFLASPISMALHVKGRQRTALVLQLFGLSVRVGAVMLAARYFESFVSEAYAVSGAVVYLVYLFVVLSVLRPKTHTLFRAVRQAAIWSLPWVGTGVAVAAGVQLAGPLLRS